MNHCPDCIRGELDDAWGLFNDLPCCRVRAVADTPKRFRAGAEVGKMLGMTPEEEQEFRAAVKRILDARKAKEKA